MQTIGQTTVLERRARTPRRSVADDAREAAVRDALERVRERCDVQARRAADPVHFVHRYARREDQELVALVASSLAFGNVKALTAKIDDALERIGPDVARAADDEARLAAALKGWRHRVYRGDDLAKLLAGARIVQKQHGTLGAALARRLSEHGGDLREALSAWAAEIRAAGKLERSARRSGPRHILADARAGSAAKRLMLLLRWMARPADGVDLGLWDVPASKLLVPVDVHIRRIGDNLGFTRQKTASWKAAEEITAALRRFDPDDPVKYDFSLCHLGMLQRCPSRRDPVRCEGCGIQSVCRHWQTRRPSRKAK